jgi:antitoxin component HigA of HigAB toxin-antitoxin module
MQLKNLTHFFNNRVYTIPDYQRGYSWQAKQVTDLLKDITHAIQLRNTHYMSTLTIHSQVEQIKVGLNNNYTSFYVVDGQQRFTTLMMIVAFILSELKKLAILEKEIDTEKEIEEKIEKYLKKKGTYLFRYAIDQTSDDFFRAVILEMENRSSREENFYTRNLLESKKTIQDFFTKSNLQYSLLDYLTAIEEKLEFNEYIVEDASDIGVVFETMNNRGLKLSDLEIVKNRLLYLISKLPPELHSENNNSITLSVLINGHWSHILKNLTLPNRVLDDDRFLSNHWVIFKGWSKNNQAKTEILDSVFTIEQMVKDPKAMAEQIQKYVNSLAQTSLHWRYINYPEDDTAFKEVNDVSLQDNLRTAFIKLNRLSNSTVRPLLLAFFPIIKNNPKDLLELCQLAEIFSFRVFSMCNRRSDTGKADIYRQCNRFHKDLQNTEIIKQAKFWLAWWADEYGKLERFNAEIDELFKSTKKQGYYSWKGLVYFLFEHEDSLRKKEQPRVSYDFAKSSPRSVEHILPQTPSKEYWQKVLEGEEFDSVKELTHSLGNLVLIRSEKNSELQNNEYPVKRDAFKNGSFSEIEIASKFSDWDKPAIDSRLEQLNDFMAKRWRLNDRLQEIYPHPNPDIESVEFDFEEDEDSDETDELA